jgi:hypothetical protein
MCMWNTSAQAEACPACTSRVHDFERFCHLFGLYADDHDAQVQDYLPEICIRGYACLPCEPGHHDYQPNFGVQECVRDEHSGVHRLENLVKISTRQVQTWGRLVLGRYKKGP